MGRNSTVEKGETTTLISVRGDAIATMMRVAGKKIGSEVDIVGERSDSDVDNSDRRGRQGRGSQMHEDKLFFC